MTENVKGRAVAKSGTRILAATISFSLLSISPFSSPWPGQLFRNPISPTNDYTALLRIEPNP
jgi:hypothetical protein